MADGDIHVYGSLKGRVVAGLNGSQDAKIFTSQFMECDLIGISDFFIIPCEYNEKLKSFLKLVEN